MSQLKVGKSPSLKHLSASRQSIREEPPENEDENIDRASPERQQIKPEFKTQSNMSQMSEGNQYYVDMINLRKKLKKEEDNRKMFTEQARRKDEELKRVLVELEQVRE